jgi:hypothetical protein
MTGTENTQGTEKVTCRRCHRPLTSPASVAAKLGPRCAAIEAATEGLSAKQTEKMEQLIADNAVVATNRENVFHIVNEAGEVIHIAHLNGNCNCAWSLRRTSAATKTCYHVAGARLLARPVIRRQAPAPAPVALPASDAIWAELGALGALDGALAAF